MSYLNLLRNAFNAPTVQKDLAKASTHLEHLGDATVHTASSVGNLAGNIAKSALSVLESVGIGYMINKTVVGEVVGGILPAAAGISTLGSWLGWGYTSSSASLATKIIAPVASFCVYHPLVTLAATTTFCFFKYTNGFENVKNTVNSVGELGVDAFHVAAAAYNVCSSIVDTVQDATKIAFLTDRLGDNSNSEDVVSKTNTNSTLENVSNGELAAMSSSKASATTVTAVADTASIIPNQDLEDDSWEILSMSETNQVAEIPLSGIVAAA